MAHVRLVGTAANVNDADRMVLQGHWIVDEGEFDEESFHLGLGEPFYLQSELGNSVASFTASSSSSSSSSTSSIQFSGKFDIALARGGRRQVAETVRLFLTASPSPDPTCCLPIEAMRIGLLGIEGTGKNEVGRFKLLGSFHPASSRFWLTKTYEMKTDSAIKRQDKKLRIEKKEEEKQRLQTEQSISLGVEVASLVETAHASLVKNAVKNAEKMEEFSVASTGVDEPLSAEDVTATVKSMNAVMNGIVKNMASFASFQSQSLNIVASIQSQLRESEARERSNLLKYENSLRIFAERISLLEKEKEKDSSYSMPAFTYPSSSSSHHKTTNVPHKQIKTSLSDEDKRKLPEMIESLSEAQMNHLVALVKEENIFPVPTTGEFEIDIALLSAKQLLQFFIVVTRVSGTACLINGGSSGGHVRKSKKRGRSVAEEEDEEDD